MSLLTTLKEGGSLAIDTIGNKPIDEDIDLLPDGNGKLNLIYTINATGSANKVTFANIQEDTYRTHLLLAHNLTSHNTTGHLNMRVSTDNGSSERTASNYYKISRYGNSKDNDKGLSRYAADTELEYALGTDNNSATNTGWGYIWFNDLGSSSQYSQFTTLNGGHNTNNSSEYFVFGGGQYAVAETHNAFTIYHNIGSNNVIGKFSLYGLQDS